MNCKRCNKEIKNPLSLRHGYGPVCWVKVQKGTGIESKKMVEKEPVIKSGNEKVNIRIKRTEIL